MQNVGQNVRTWETCRSAGSETQWDMLRRGRARERGADRRPVDHYWGPVDQGRHGQEGGMRLQDSFPVKVFSGALCLSAWGLSVQP